jgi:hypothetical protein
VNRERQLVCEALMFALEIVRRCEDEVADGGEDKDGKDGGGIWGKDPSNVIDNK